MFRILLLLLCITLGLGADSCRRKVPLNPQPRCGSLQTMFNEGECLCCYYDTANPPNPSIGIGYNLNRADAAKVMGKYNLTWSNVVKDCLGGTTFSCLTDTQAKDLFMTQIYPEAASCADQFSPGLHPVKRAAIIDMAFMGCAKLKKFVNMQAALKKQDWATAAKEARNSNWCKQVGKARCDSDSNCISSFRGQTSQAGCTKGQTCGTYTFDCSSYNPNCACLTIANSSKAFCADPSATLCATLPNCDSCPSSTSACVINSCCVKPVCLPLSLAQACNDPPTGLGKNKLAKRLQCNHDIDCNKGTVCAQHLAGKYCV